MRSALTAIVSVLLSGAVFQLAAQEADETNRQRVEETKAKAEAGDAEAEYYLGLMYATGEDIPKDPAKAVKWFRKAAEQNHAQAQDSLGSCYFFGQGVTEDKVEGVKWFRKAAEQGNAAAQGSLGDSFFQGEGVPKDAAEGVKWSRKAAEQGDLLGQYNLGLAYFNGDGVSKSFTAAVKWFRKAAEQNDSNAEHALGNCYLFGNGVTKDTVEAVKWYRRAAEQNYAEGQHALGSCYYKGEGVPKDEVEAYKWFLIAAGNGNERAKRVMAFLERRLTREQTAEGQKLARNFKPHPREVSSDGSNHSSESTSQSRPRSSGSGFFITEDGYLITNEHVAGRGAKVRVLTAAGAIWARVVKVDTANDLALLKVEGKFTALPVATSRPVRLGDTVATVGFPNVTMQGFAPKFARGEIGSLSGPQDDGRYFQISVPVQPGNSGGALVDERGNVVGVVSAKLSAKEALSRSGALPENVNYAVKSSFLLSFLESVPDIAVKLKEPNAKDLKFADVVEQTKEAAALVLVY